MIIKASASLRNEYTVISDLAKKTMEPVYITRNGEGDGVYMNIDAFERREQLLDMREKVLLAEEERLLGKETFSIKEVRTKLRERANANKG